VKIELDANDAPIVVYNMYVPLKRNICGRTMIRQKLQNSLDKEGTLQENKEYLSEEIENEIDRKPDCGRSRFQ